MASIYARNGKLQVKYKDSEGAWKRKSTGLDDTKANRAMVKRELVPALEKAVVKKEVKVERELFSKYAALYLKSIEHQKSYWEYHNRMGRITSYFEDRDIREIQVSELRVWLSTFDHLSQKTVSMYKSNCKAVFDMAIEDELMDKNPFVHILTRRNSEDVQEEIHPFSQEEVVKLLEHTSGDLRTFLAIGFYTGMRAGEILGLQISDIEDDTISVKRGLSKGKVSTPKTKSSVRRVPMFDVLRPYIKEQMQKSIKAKSIWLFQNEGKHVYGVATIRGKKETGVWARVLRELRLNYIPIKNTRHTFIVAMLKSDVFSMLEVAQTVGHTNTTMIMKHYARYIEGEQLKISRKFNPFECDHARGHKDVHIM